VGFHGDNFNVGIRFLEISARTHDGSSSADPGNEMGNFLLSLPIDLWTRGFVMSLRIHRIKVLIRLEIAIGRSEEHTSELQSLTNLVCRLLLEKKKKRYNKVYI